ncbi:MAG: NADH-quinone oxidoreductase subunit J [Desulfobacterales bacterium]|nr:NADH-quinone oxidoreductase subunit J [Desulfobacterales bacterium]
MTIYAILFYLIAAVMILSTAMAVTRSNMVHAVLYLVISFFGSAVLFFLLGAPLLGALEVIIYAGAIMVLFLFIVMMLKVEVTDDGGVPIGQLAAAGVICGIYFLACVLLMKFSGPSAKEPMQALLVQPKHFGNHLFRQHWLAIEMISLLLLVALVGVLHLGLSRGRRREETKGGDGG